DLVNATRFFLQRWQEETRRVDEIRTLSAQLETLHHQRKDSGGSSDNQAAEVARLQAELDARTRELRALQGEAPLMQVCVDSQTIAEVIAGWTGIPIGKMLADEIKTVLNLKSKLEERVIGQAHALEAIS